MDKKKMVNTLHIKIYKNLRFGFLQKYSPVDAVFEYSDTNWTGSQDQAANGKFDVHIWQM